MNILRNSGVALYYAIPAGVILTDLAPHVMKGEYRETMRKGRNIALLFIAQYIFRKIIPGMSISNQFMIGVQCYTRVNYRDKNIYVSSIVAVATAILGLRSLLSGNRGFADLAVAGVTGIGFGTLPQGTPYTGEVSCDFQIDGKKITVE